MNRSSPLNVTPTSSCEPPAFTASAARYSPTGHPSVRRTSSCTSAFGHLHVRGPHQRRPPRRVHRQIVDADLDDAALGAQASRRQRQRVAGADRQLRPCRQTQGDGGERVEALAVGHRLEVVDDEGNGPPHGVHRRDQTPGDIDTDGRAT